MSGRTLISRLPSISPSFLLASRFAAARSLTLPRASLLLRHRSLLTLAEPRRLLIGPSGGSVTLRCFSTRPTTSSLNDPSPNWSNRPPKETILLDGCDFEHWLVVMEPPDPNLTRDDIIDSYIKTLSQVVGSEDEAKMKIYSVSTKHYFAFGALVSEELSYKIKTLPNVRWVLPDSYLDVRNKDYGGEPFIDGKAVPYDPKYHEEWVRNNARANERSRRNDRPRNFDRSRNFDRRRENMQTFQNRDAPPMPNQAQYANPVPSRGDMPPMPGSTPQNAMHPPPRDMPPVPPRDMPPVPPRDMGDFSRMPNRDFNAAPNTQSSYVPNRDGGSGYQGSGQGYQGGNPVQGGPAYQGGGQGYQPGQQGGGPGYRGGGGPSYTPGGPGYQGGGGSPSYQSNGAGYQGGGPGNQGGGYGHQGGGPGNQGGGYGQQGGGGPSYQGGGPAYPPRDMPGRD